MLYDILIIDKIIKQNKMEIRKLLCDVCKAKVRKAEADYQQKRRKKLKIKVASPQVNGKVKINIKK